MLLVCPISAACHLSGLTALFSQYYANNLDSRPHTLVVTCAPETGTGPFIDVDSFTIYSTASGTSISASMPAPAATLASSSPALVLLTQERYIKLRGNYLDPQVRQQIQH
jgi:hypothetical protein